MMPNSAVTVRVVANLILIAVGYLVVLVQTLFTPKPIIPLAYDSGGVTTSSVTVPLITALGLGLSGALHVRVGCQQHQRQRASFVG